MASPRVKRLLLSGLPSWIPRASGISAPLVFDFVGQRSYVLGQWGRPESFLTVSSSANGWYLAPSGLWVNAAANTLRYHASSSTLAAFGVLIEEARTNVVLWNRDLTNGAWVAVNVTAAKTQIGIDGVTNNASSITSTAGNGTILQTVVLASSARFQSAFVKRLTGTGTVNMTTDGGLTWTAITVTAAFTQVTVPTQTLANPIVGFQIVTSGDAIAVDMVQNENGTFVTSPIATTTVAVTRAIDLPSLSLPAVLQSRLAYTLSGSGVPNAPTTFASNQSLGAISDGTTNNRLVVRRTSSTATYAAIVTQGGSDRYAQSAGTWSQSVAGAIAVAGTAGDQRAAYSRSNLLSAGSDANFPSNISTMQIGAGGASTTPWNGTVSTIELWASRVSDDALQKRAA